MAEGMPTTMPKIVDHDQRRSELAEAALRVIGRDGFEAATTRAVALESGWSTGVAKHYFRNKDELLRASLRVLERRNLARFDAVAARSTGLAAIEAAVEAILDSERDETRVWISFVSRATVDRATSTAWRQAGQMWAQRWAELVRRGLADGSIAAGVDADAAGTELHALVSGLRIRSFFSRERPRTASALMLLDALRPDSSRGR